MFQLYKIASFAQGSLFASPRPDGANLTGSLEQITSANVRKVVCLLESEELQTLGLASLQAQCLTHHIEFIHFPITDFGVPALESLCDIINEVQQTLLSGRNTLIHCRGGIGRTGTLCSCIMIANGSTPEQAIRHVSLQRGCEVPETRAQRELIKQFYDHNSDTP